MYTILVRKLTKLFGTGLLTILVFIGLASAAQAETMTYFTDRTTDFVKINPKDYEFHMVDNKNYGESYFLNAWNRKGDAMSFLVSVSNYNPFDDFAGTFDMTLLGDDGSNVTIHQEFKEKQTKINQPGGKHSWGPNTLTVVPGKEIVMDFDTEDVDDNPIKGQIHMKIVAEPVQHDEKGLTFGDDPKEDRYWQVLVAGPMVEVKITGTRAGKPISFEGIGYIDHGWATEKVPSFAEQWNRLRVFKDGWGINLFQIIPDKSYGDNEAHTLNIHKDGKLIGSFADWEYKALKTKFHAKSKYTYPTELTFAMNNDVIEMTGTVKVVKMVEAVDMLGRLGWFTRKMIKAFYSNPWQMYMYGDVDFKIKYKGQEYEIKDKGMMLAEFY